MMGWASAGPLLLSLVCGCASSPAVPAYAAPARYRVRFASPGQFETLFASIAVVLAPLGYEAHEGSDADAAWFRGYGREGLRIRLRQTPTALRVDFVMPSQDVPRRAILRAIRAMACVEGMGAIVDADGVPTDVQVACPSAGGPAPPSLPAPSAPTPPKT